MRVSSRLPLAVVAASFIVCCGPPDAGPDAGDDLRPDADAGFADAGSADAGPPPNPDVVVSGSVTLIDDAQAAAFAASGTTLITGDLIVGPAVTALTATRLQTLGGTLRLGGAAALTTLDLPRLAVCAGLVLDDADALTAFNLPALVYVGGTVSVRQTASLTSLAGLLGLQRVEGDLVVEDNAELTELARLSRVSSIEGRFVVRGNPKLRDVSVGGVGSVGGDLVIDDNALLTDVSGLTGLGRVGGDLVVTGNDTLADTQGFVDVDGVGGNLVVSDNTALPDLVGLAHVDNVGGDLTVSGNSALDSVEGLAFDDVGGDVLIAENPALRSLDGVAVGGVGGELVVRDNAVLQDVQNLSGLDRVDGDVRLDNNQALAIELALALLQILVDDGIVDSGRASVDGRVIFARTVVTTRVVAPVAGDRVLRGDTLVLAADVTANGATTTTWQLRPDNGPAVDLGVGDVLQVPTDSLPVGPADIVATTRANDVVVEDAVGVFVDALEFEPSLTPSTLVQNVVTPGLVDGVDGLSLGMARGQPVALRGLVLHPFDGDLSDRIGWRVDNTLVAIGDTLDLSPLTEGEHDVVAEVTDRQGRTASSTLHASVGAFVFSASPAQPTLSDLYLDVVPLVVDVSHPFQQVFGAATVSWRDDDGDVIAQAAAVPTAPGSFRSSTSTRLLAAGPHTLSVEVRDALGNVATGSTSLVVTAVDFVASIVQPLTGLVLDPDTALTIQTSASHTLVPDTIAASALRVQYSSTRGGVLLDGAGASSFAVDELVQLVSLPVGSQTITATVSDGTGRTARSSILVVVRANSISAQLTEPLANTVILPATPVRFTGVVALSPGATSLITFKIDGVEVPANFDDYGVDASALARATLNLGNFNAAAAPFLGSPFFTPGRHIVEFSARLTSVVAACSNEAGRAFCAQSAYEVVDVNGLDLCPSDSSRTINSGTEVWAGTRRLNCDVNIDSPGQLIIPAGARILVNAGRRLNFIGGSLLIGDPDVAEPTTIEVPGSVSDTAWDGITGSVSSDEQGVLIIANAVIKNATRGVGVSGLGTATTAEHRFEITSTTFKDCDRAIAFSSCPTIMDDVVIDNPAGTDALFLNNGGGFCDDDRVYRRLEVRGGTGPVTLTSPGGVTLVEPVFFGARGDALVVNGDGGDTTITGGSFTSIGSGGAAINVLGGARTVRFDGNDVVDASVGVVAANTNTVAGETLITRNTFDDVATAVRFGSAGKTAIHGNAFFGTGVAIQAQLSSAPALDDIAAQGNFFGDPQTAAILRSAVAGVAPNLPSILDSADDATRTGSVHYDAPLLTLPAGAPLPSTFFSAPEQAGHYGDCVPIEVDGVLGPVQFASSFEADDDVVLPTGGASARCKLFMLGASNDVRASDRTRVERDGDRCLATTLRPGARVLAALCTRSDGLVDELRAPFLRDDSAVAGTLGRPLTRWSGTVDVVGDVVVPAGSVLDIAPGTLVRIAGFDALHRQPSIDNVDVGRYADVGNRQFGNAQLVDIDVAGTLNAKGTVGEPIEFAVATAGPVFEGLWGGIRVHRQAIATIAHVVASGADDFVHGEFTPSDANLGPAISLSDIDISESRSLSRGVCPVTMSGVTARRVGQMVRDGHCRSGVLFTDLDLVDVGSVANVSTATIFELDDYAAGGPPTVSATIERVSLVRSGRSAAFVAAASGSRVAVVTIRDGDLQGLATVVQTAHGSDVPRSEVLIERTLIQRFNLVVAAPSVVDRIVLADSAFVDGAQLIESNINVRGQIELRHNRFTDVLNNMGGSVLMRADFVNSFTATQNRFERSGTIFAVDNISLGQTADLRFNEFVGTTGSAVAVLFFNGAANETLDIDATGSFWADANGIALSSVAVEALIVDPQANRGADFKGRTQYAPTAPAPFIVGLR